jgi:hypothetical protein
VPHRRLTALPLALLASVALAGCAVDIKPGSVPAPFSVAPVPSASAGQPAYICTAVYKILTDGAVTLAEYVAGSGDDAKQGMRQTFSSMATEVSAQSAVATDPDLKRAIDAIAADLTAGSRQADPAAYVNGRFQTVGQKLDGVCQ